MTRSLLPALGMLAFVSRSMCAEPDFLPRLNLSKNRSTIPGLLEAAASTACDSTCTEVCCPNGGCCAIATICCSDGGCCPAGNVDGVKGCCPFGQVCTAPASGPTTSDDGPGTTTKMATTTKGGTTTTKSPTTTDGEATRTHSAVSNTPSPSAGYKVVVVPMSSSDLVFVGSWAVSNSSMCGANGASQTVSSDTDPAADISTVTYQFTGTSVYVKSASIAAHYMIQLDDDVTEYGGSQLASQTNAPPNCSYGWWRDGLEYASHTLSVTVYGSNSTTTQNAAWALELQNFVVVEKTGSGSGSSGSGSGSWSGAGTTASVGMLGVLFMVGFWILLI
ncbi:hypothetical protein C8F04DRAFT_1131817 [Mycena alexandri]|uniref:GPI anchored protein n=1 Tax=Mycena alexandri TaxID=1745969 RepID=A0AAD6SFB8_9AGAR|nr:hypothetical protein C8F04DRAFT_1131817 [Mycena alexandri]